MDHAALLEVLFYDPDTGIFIWKISRGRCKAGQKAGSVNAKGYIEIHVFGKKYLAHQLAWFYMTAEWPEDQVDHWNRLPGDNTWLNLREADTAKQTINSVRANPYGRGVVKSGSKFKSSIGVDGKRLYLGTFNTVAEAQEAYRLAAQKFYGEFVPEVQGVTHHG
jgi:hypothetical protein